jgi:hypothetical protein
VRKTTGFQRNLDKVAARSVYRANLLKGRSLLRRRERGKMNLTKDERILTGGETPALRWVDVTSATHRRYFYESRQIVKRCTKTPAVEGDGGVRERDKESVPAVQRPLTNEKKAYPDVVAKKEPRKRTIRKEQNKEKGSGRTILPSAVLFVAKTTLLLPPKAFPVGRLFARFLKTEELFVGRGRVERTSFRLYHRKFEVRAGLEAVGKKGKRMRLIPEWKTQELAGMSPYLEVEVEDPSGWSGERGTEVRVVRRRTLAEGCYFVLDQAFAPDLMERSGVDVAKVTKWEKKVNDKFGRLNAKAKVFGRGGKKSKAGRPQ